MNPGSRGYLRYTTGSAGQLHIPGAYGSEGRGSRLTYTVAPWQFGLALIAATPKGISWLGIHQCGAYLEAELRKDLARTEITRDDEVMRTAAKPVIAFMNGTVTSLDLPVDLGATPSST
jgi:hypothetical protein